MIMKEAKGKAGDGMKTDLVNTAVAAAPHTFIEAAIHVVCGMRVMLDMDLARIYKVSTGQLNRAVQRNRVRFPQQFMFQLTRPQYDNLKCQIGISSLWGGRRKLPYVFTEHGAVMLASVLRSETAVVASIQVVMAFVRLRGILAEHKELKRKMDDLEAKYDAQFKTVFDAIRALMMPPAKPAKRIAGFGPGQ